MLRTICLVSLFFAFSPRTLAQDHADRLLFTLQRTECYGDCPSYKLTIRGDGSVVYEGYKYVRVSGVQKYKIKPSEVQDLLKLFMDLNFFDLDDEYISIKHADGTETVVTDLPTTFTSITVGERFKKIVNYVGAPENLELLESKIDEVAGSKHWVFIDAAGVHAECRLGWDLRKRDALLLLRRAAESGDSDVVKAFIDEGADVNADVNSITPLQLARGAKVVKLLIDAGANVNAISKNGLGPPLSRAAAVGDTDAIAALVKAGAKINGKSTDGETALMVAAQNGNVGAVEALLAARANVRMKDSFGQDALGYMRNGLDRNISDEKHADSLSPPISDFRSRFDKIEELLLAAGASPEKVAPR
jgi:hypothetical protein